MGTAVGIGARIGRGVLRGSAGETHRLIVDGLPCRLALIAIAAIGRTTARTSRLILTLEFVPLTSTLSSTGASLIVRWAGRPLLEMTRRTHFATQVWLTIIRQAG